MQSSLQLEVFCPNLNCGYERMDIGNPEQGIKPTKTRHHRPMAYRGSRKVGVFKRGQYHFYGCPVCREEAIFFEIEGVLERVD